MTEPTTPQVDFYVYDIEQVRHMVQVCDRYLRPTGAHKIKTDARPTGVSIHFKWEPKVDPLRVSSGFAALASPSLVEQLARQLLAELEAHA